ncbi:MAG: ribbon-helix-helix domain-containing protein [Rhizobiaceae bacterium]
MTKNITLAVEEEALRKLRRIAAEQDTSVNALVREAMNGIIERSSLENRRREAAEKMLELSRNSKVRLGEDYKFSREEAYANRLSRFEHRGVRGDGGS